MFSRSGTHIAFERKTLGAAGPGVLYVARVDGREPIAVTPEPLPQIHDVSFSPDGRELLFTSEAQDQHRQIHIAQTDGTGIRVLDVGTEGGAPSWRPPDGAEILFSGKRGAADPGPSLYAIDVHTNAVRTIAATTTESVLDVISWSPDGSRVAYVHWVYDPGGPCNNRVHVVGADGTRDITLPLPPDAVCDDAPHWSNGGSRLVILRNYSPTLTDTVLAIVPADGSGLGIETDHGICCLNTEWSPDDTSILITPEDQAGAPLPPVIVDPATGAMAPASWIGTSNPAWQRKAP